MFCKSVCWLGGFTVYHPEEPNWEKKTSNSVQYDKIQERQIDDQTSCLTAEWLSIITFPGIILPIILRAPFLKTVRQVKIHHKLFRNTLIIFWLFDSTSFSWKLPKMEVLDARREKNFIRSSLAIAVLLMRRRTKVCAFMAHRKKFLCAILENYAPWRIWRTPELSLPFYTSYVCIFIVLPSSKLL